MLLTCARTSATFAVHTLAAAADAAAAAKVIAAQLSGPEQRLMLYMLLHLLLHLGREQTRQRRQHHQARQQHSNTAVGLVWPRSAIDRESLHVICTEQYHICISSHRQPPHQQQHQQQQQHQHWQQQPSDTPA